MHNYKYLYHVTNSDRLKSIFSEGLKKNRGHHCKIIGDYTEPVVFLCREQDIDFWMKCLKDVDVVLKVNVEKFNLKYRKQSNYIEFGYFGDISPDKISIWGK